MNTIRVSNGFYRHASGCDKNVIYFLCIFLVCSCISLNNYFGYNFHWQVTPPYLLEANYNGKLILLAAENRISLDSTRPSFLITNIPGVVHRNKRASSCTHCIIN